MFSASVPLFEEAKLRGDAKQAQAQLDSQKAQLSDLRGQIDADIRDAFLDLNSAAQEVEVAHSNVQLANQTLSDAQERYAAHPFERHVLLPIGRMLDMWLRPRVENLPIDLDWWVYSKHNAETRFSWFYAGLNAVYLLLGIVGLWLRPKVWKWMLAYIVLRSMLLLTVEAPEARYTLECFPMLFLLGGVGLYRFWYWVLLSVLKLNASEGRG